jgi:hypothetical protein
MKHINIDIVTELLFPLACVELPVLLDMRVLNVIPPFNLKGQACQPPQLRIRRLITYKLDL